MLSLLVNFNNFIKDDKIFLSGKKHGYFFYNKNYKDVFNSKHPLTLFIPENIVVTSNFFHGLLFNYIKNFDNKSELLSFINIDSLNGINKEEFFKMLNRSFKNYG